MLAQEDIEHYEQMTTEKLGGECAYWLSTGIFKE